MTLLIVCIMLYQFDWPWYWYPIATAIWALHEFQLYVYFKPLRRILAREKD